MEGRERMSLMIDSVLDEVVRKLTGKAPYRGPCYLLLVLPESRPGFSDEDAALVSQSVGSRLPEEWQVRAGIAGRGHAGAIRAVQKVLRESSRGADGLFLIVGADSYHHVDTFMWLEGQRRFTQPNIRGGFIPGEGAGCLALVKSGGRVTRDLGLAPLAVVGGVGLAEETLLRDSDTGSFGVGMSAAVEAATKGLQLPRDQVDTLYSDINGERYRSEEWGFVAMKTYPLWQSLEYEAPGSSWGDVGAAFGTLAAVLAAESFARGYARGPRAVVMSGSDSGMRGAMLIQDPRAR
jgi:3-oxoacyl-[acyl-carrier-protein] synthase-1